MTKKIVLTQRQRDVMLNVCYGPVVFYKRGYKPHEACVKKGLARIVSDPIGVLDILRPTIEGKRVFQGYGGY